MGMNMATGRDLTGIDHLSQSINDILSTPIGSRVMRREYGSDLPDLIDAPMTPELTVDVFAAVALALDRWEPRYRVKRIWINEARAGFMDLGMSGLYLVEGKPLVLEGIIIQ